MLSDACSCRHLDYSIRRPLIARPMTSCWICSVPSKMSKIFEGPPEMPANKRFPEAVRCPGPRRSGGLDEPECANRADPDGRGHGQLNRHRTALGSGGSLRLHRQVSKRGAGPDRLRAGRPPPSHRRAPAPLAGRTVDGLGTQAGHRPTSPTVLRGEGTADPCLTADAHVQSAGSGNPSKPSTNVPGGVASTSSPSHSPPTSTESTRPGQPANTAQTST